MWCRSAPIPKPGWWQTIVSSGLFCNPTGRISEACRMGRAKRNPSLGFTSRLSFDGFHSVPPHPTAYCHLSHYMRQLVGQATPDNPGKIPGKARPTLLAPSPIKAISIIQGWVEQSETHQLSECACSFVFSLTPPLLPIISEAA
jgi:hypothetical protein